MSLQQTTDTTNQTNGGTANDDLGEIDAELRNHIRRLGRQLGDSLVRQHGPELLERVEQVRHLSRNLRLDDVHSSTELSKVLDDVDVVDAIQLVRAFTVYFHLANTAEQVCRVEDLQASSTLNQSFADTVARLQDAGIPNEDIINTTANADLRPVFTAHPTEASRRSILDKLAEIAELVESRTTEVDPRSRSRIDRRVDELIDAIWQTDEIRRARPDPIDEARSILYFLTDSVSQGLPEVLEDVDAALREIGGSLPTDSVPLRFGSWVGGDRDGNPNVTPQITHEVLALQRERALRILIDAVEELGSELSVSSRVAPISEELADQIEADHATWPDIMSRLNILSEGEPYRQRLGIIRRRLMQTAETPPGPESYATPADLETDLAVLARLP